MKAYILNEAGEIGNLILSEIDKPNIQADEVLVEVKAISLNPVDAKVRAVEEAVDMIVGTERPVILGWDIAGKVAAAGENVTLFETGDSVFIKVLRKYFEKYKYRNASTADFQEICEQVSGKNLDKFFDQWINGEGEIELEYEWKSEKKEDEYENSLFLYQVQKEYDTYHFPLEVLIQLENGEEERYLFEINSRETQIKIKTIDKVKFVILNPDNWLLMSAREL
jgi:hypothetical protein